MGQTAISQRHPTAASRVDVEKIRKDFPILKETIYGKPLVYLDNAATTQKPQAVIDAVTAVYSKENSNIHRGVHLLSQRATESYERARVKMQTFLNAAQSQEIVFLRGVTEAINLVAATYGKKHVQAGDEVIISAMEHHSNIVPWQILCQEKEAKLRIIPIDDRGELLLEEYEKLLNSRTRIVAVAHVSNALGTVNPVGEIIDLAHERGIPVLIDGAQAGPHCKVNVQELGCDFYAVSGHKLYGPTGVGILFGKSELLEALPPYQSGGDMIRSVTFEETIYDVPPYKFEAGTPNVAGGIGLGVAVEYVSQIGLSEINRHESELLSYATKQIQEVPGVRIIGTARQKASVLSFVLGDIHAHDVGTILDQEGIAVRTGHHCAQPVMERFGVPATVRVSLAMYNTKFEIDAFVKALHKVREILK